MIGIIISTVREGRFGDRVADWICNLGNSRVDMRCETVDLRDYPLPIFGTAGPGDDVVRRWATKMDEFDGFIFVTAEYNHSIPGVLKNALDYIDGQYARKPAAFVGYGGVGGARAVEQLRLICNELQSTPIGPAVHIGTEAYQGVLDEGKSFSDYPYLHERALAVLDELTWWTRTLKSGRDSSVLTF